MLPFFSYSGKIYSYDPKYQDYLITIFIFITCILSDFLDGYIARKYRLESIYGRYLDPICDKLFTITGLLLVTQFFHFPLLILLLITIRELLGALVGTILFFKFGFQGTPNLIGKLSVLLVSFNIFYYLSFPLFQTGDVYHLPAYALVFVYSVGAFLYLREYKIIFGKGEKIARRGT